MKRIITTFLLIILIALLIPKPTNAVVGPTYYFYVNDYANILSPETEQFIMNNSIKLNDATKAQIVVVTVPSLDGQDIESYATELFRDFGIGDKDLNNGLLILVALEERLCRIEVGYGLEGVLPDGKTGRYQDVYMIPYFKEDNFDEGIVNGYKAFFATIAKEYNYETDIIPYGAPLEVVDNYDKYEIWIGISVIIFIVQTIGISIAQTILFHLEKKKMKERKSIFIFLVSELITIIISVLIGVLMNPIIASVYFTLGTIFSISRVFGGSGGYGGHYHGGRFSGGGGGFSGRRRIFWWWRLNQRLLNII